MTYDSNLQATQQESMPELYEFSQAGIYERVTSYAENVTFLGNEFEAVPIKRSGFSCDSEFGATSITLSVGITTLFRQYIANQPIEPVRITIYRSISSDLSSYAIIFDGYLKAVSVEGNQASATCESRSKILRTRIPTVFIQSYCNHDVFDGGCTLSGSEWRVAGTVSVISGSTITASAWGAYADQYFRGGKVQLGNDFRMITDHTGNTLSLQIPFDSRMELGSIAYAFPGCDGAAATCRDKFDNLEHFLGFPYVPSHNPVIWGV